MNLVHPVSQAVPCVHSSFRIFCSPIEELWNGTKFRPLRGGAQKGTKKNRTPDDRLIRTEWLTTAVWKGAASCYAVFGE